MKLLLVHNDYGKPSGEEAVVAGMEAMMRGKSWEVARLRMSTAGVRDTLRGKVSAFASGLYSPKGVSAMREVLKSERPDVVNVHNLYPFISPAALFECRRAGVPVVMTIHNFRLVCPTGLFMRDGSPCEECLRRGNEWGCVAHNCEGSILKSTAYAARNAVARLSGAYRKCVDRYACITDFQRRKLTEAGLPGERMLVIPNSIAVGEEPEYGRGEYVAFCGRLSREKGVDMIIETARQNPHIPFRLAGELRDQELADDLPRNVRLEGFVSGGKLEEFYRGARFCVMASRCYEGFPMSILEAARYGRATIAPDHGGFTEIIGHGEGSVGRLFRPGHQAGLEQGVRELWENPRLTAELGKGAFDKLRTHYSTEVVADRWDKLLRGLADTKTHSLG